MTGFISLGFKTRSKCCRGAWCKTLFLSTAPFKVYSLTWIKLTLVAEQKILVFFEVFFSLPFTPQWDYFPCMQWNISSPPPVISCYISHSFFIIYFPSRAGAFFVVVVVFWKNSPHNCRCNALSASLEVIMRSVCFCEDNRESQGISSYFPDGRVGVERRFVCIETDRGRQIWKNKVMSPTEYPIAGIF